MPLMLFSVRDSKVGSFANPFVCRTKGEAHRSFEDACKDENLPFRKHPSDYDLWLVATFDDATGVLQPVGPDRIIGADEF